ncbi:MAG: hypothetical protein Q9220_002104 [cf. Caloplaca sp. 1 TL-2023]
METSNSKRSSSRNRPPSRPTTPLRPSSRTSLRESQTFTPGGSSSSAFPLDALEPAFAELSDTMADLEANFMHLQLMHESLSRFNENFASFLYGLNMNAFCVDFPEAPIPESFRRARQNNEDLTPIAAVENNRLRPESDQSIENENEASFLTTDTSFFDKPASAKKPSKYTGPATSNPRPGLGSVKRGAHTALGNRGGRGETRGTKASGIARGKPRGAR